MTRREFSFALLAATSVPQRNAWIWTGRPTSRAVSFRRTFRGRAGKTALRIFADTRYAAWWNGKYLGCGPARFDPRFPEFDELTVHRTAGTNVLAVLVETFPRSNAWYIAHRPGLWFEVDGIQSGPETRWSDFGAYSSEAPVTWPTAAEWLDARRLPPNWIDPEYDDSDWLPSKPVDGYLWGRLQPRSIPLLDEREREGKVMPGTATIIDFGESTLARPSLHFEADEGAELELRYAEDGEDYLSLKDRYTARSGEQRWETTDSRGFRYLKVTARGGEVRNLSAKAYERLYPVHARGTFACSDPLLTEIWARCVRTTHLCMEDAYIDTPMRERAQWIADTVAPGFHANLAGFGDTALYRRMLRQLGESQDQTGKIAGLGSDVLQADWKPRFTRGHIEPGWIWAHYPADRNDIHRYIEDYMLIWVLGLRDYYEQTLDRAFVAAEWGHVVKLLEWFHTHRTPRGLVRAREFVYFGNPRAYQTGEGAALNIFYRLALKAAARLAAALGKQAPYAARGHEIEAAIRKHMIRDGLVLSMLDGKKEYPPTVHANVLALLAGVLPAGEEAKASGWVEQEMAQESLSPYFYYWLFEMLYRLEEREHGAQRVLDLIRQKWAVFLPLGTVREDFSSAAPAHIAATSPAWALSAGVLGVRVVEKRGVREIQIDPRPGDLDWAEGAVPTTLGLVRVSHRKHDGRWQSEIEVPPSKRAIFRGRALRSDKDTVNWTA